MPSYGGGNVLFEHKINPFPSGQMPFVAVADTGALPATVGPGSGYTSWTSGWADGGPAWVAQPCETLAAFKARIYASCHANGTLGVIVNIWERSGFWELNLHGQAPTS